jgi:hypothetical protein
MQNVHVFEVAVEPSPAINALYVHELNLKDVIRVLQLNEPLAR